jgi:hypothetical protein
MKDKINVPPYVNTAKGQTTDYVIRAGMLCEIQRSPGDVTILPDADKLITEKEWVALVEKHGSEEAVVKVLDCEDTRPAKKVEDVLEAFNKWAITYAGGSI